MTNIHYQKARFMLSVANLKQLPSDLGAEIAFVGRSNAGKSSVLNRLTQQKGLARVSNTPGRTQLINFFSINDHHRLVDLPGYGFAKVPLGVKQQWGKLIDSYLQSRHSLKGLVLIIDIRHPMKELDQQVLAWCDEKHLSVHIVLNKSDKLSHEKSKKTLLEVKKMTSVYSNLISLQTFSALKGIGIDELKKHLDRFFLNKSQGEEVE